MVKLQKGKDMNKIKVTFIFNLEDSFSTDMTSGFVTFLNYKNIDDYKQLIELLVDADKLQEIKVDKRNDDGFYYTYHPETFKIYKHENETKYHVTTWEMEE